MIIYLKNKETLVIDDFYLKCCVGKNGLNSEKREGDYSTPKGLFNINKLYFRKDRISKIKSKIKTRVIKKDMAWCDDPFNSKYNEEIKVLKKNNKENLFRKDNKYDYILTINFNYKKIPNKV